MSRTGTAVQTATPARVTPVRATYAARLRSRQALAVFMTLPLILLIGSLIVYPFFYAIYLSMLNKRETAFIGLDNYRFLLTRDTFWLVVRTSFLFTFMAVLWKAVLGFTLALVIHTLPARGQRVWRGLALIPWVMPLALSSLGWWWIYEPTHSALNWVLTALGMSPKPWLSDPFWARFSVILVNNRYGTPFFMITYLAGLKSIPQELYESSAIDGAGPVQRLVHITLPMLKNIIAITLLFSTIVTLATFDIVRVLTRGGPRNHTHLFGTYAFELGIASGDVPLGAAVSLFMFPILAVPAERRVNRRTRRAVTLMVCYALIGAFMVFFLFPPYWMAITSFKTNQEIESLSGIPLIIQQGATLTHYRDLFAKTDFMTYFRNSVLVTIPTVLISMFISVLAAYALSRLGFRGAAFIGTAVFLVYLVPDSLLFIPLFKVIGWLGLLNSKWSLVVVFPTAIVPFATWLLIGYFASIPKELDEAALVDGANHFQMLWRIFVPVALPGLIAATIFAFTISWSGFLYPLAFIFSSDQQVLTTGTVTSLIKGDVYHWGGLMAGALLACLPPVVIYVFLMDYYISGLTAGSTKG
jgi:multiple sugar transport system permease protein